MRSDDDDTWIDKEPTQVGSIVQLSEKEPVGVPYERAKFPMGFCTIPGAHKGQRPPRWRKVRV